MRNKIIILIGLLIVIAFTSITATAAPASLTPKPSEGWTLHIDAKRHFPSNPDLIAHHYCKPVTGGLTQCQLYDNDRPDARLVGVEMIVNTETYNSFNETEKALWHYHKTEIPRVEATLPDLSPEEAAKVVKSIEETYGKIYILWDPGRSNLPIGYPEISILGLAPIPTPTLTPAVTPSTPIPEFPAFVLPIAAIIGLILMLAKRKED